MKIYTKKAKGFSSIYEVVIANGTDEVRLWCSSQESADYLAGVLNEMDDCHDLLLPYKGV
jgi:hypothetical protein